jgi:hypothetical protein
LHYHSQLLQVEKTSKLANDLNNALKSSKQVSWTATESHNRAAFDFNGKTVMALL